MSEETNEKRGISRRSMLLSSAAALGAVGAATSMAREASAQSSSGSGDRPNILVIWGDDVGQSNISAYTMGLMGYRTPNIDRVANEGMIFTDYYGEQSCTAGRSSFIMGQSVFRTGLSKVGLPGAELGMREEDPTIAGLLKGQGYATGQFGKNHLGDRDEHLPTNHGFDVFFGNLYHLNAEEEPEDGGTRMHFRTHVSDERRAMANDIAGKHVDEYSAGMIEHDMHIGQFLDLLDELGIADNTIVHYSTDNGPHMNTWPDAAMTPFWGEKNTNWEGAWRVPSMVRWPGKIETGTVSDSIMHHMDWLPTYLAAAGRPTVKEELLDGITVAEVGGGRDYRVHLDGYNFLPYLTGEEEKAPREEIFYFSDDGDLMSLRWNDWKLTFLEQKARATFRAWQEPLTELRVPLIFNLRRDPYERSYRTSNTYNDWLLDRAYLLVPAQDYVGNFLATFQEYPPRQKAASFSLDQVMEKLTSPAGNP